MLGDSFRPWDQCTRYQLYVGLYRRYTAFD